MYLIVVIVIPKKVISSVISFTRGACFTGELHEAGGQSLNSRLGATDIDHSQRAGAGHQDCAIDDPLEIQAQLGIRAISCRDRG